MDNQITAKAYIVRKREGCAVEFLDVLKEIEQKSLKDRQVDINLGQNSPLIVRLERLEGSQQGYVCGELVRKQTDNIPPEANDSGLTPVNLSADGGLGYSSAFSFHGTTSSLVLQSNRVAVSAPRLRLYLESWRSDAKFDFDQIAKEDSWSRFNSGVPRKLKMRIASPTTHPANLNDTAQTVSESAANIAEALGGSYITIEISMGAKKGGLLKNKAKSIISALRKADDNQEMDIRTLSATVKPGEGESDVVDFLQEYLAFKDVLSLPSDDADKNYDLRKKLLRKYHQEHIDYIREHY